MLSALGHVLSMLSTGDGYSGARRGCDIGGSGMMVMVRQERPGNGGREGMRVIDFL